MLSTLGPPCLALQGNPRMMVSVRFPNERGGFLSIAAPLTASGANTWSSASSVSAEIFSDTAAAFSSSRCRWLVPGIGTRGAGQNPGERKLRRGAVLGCGMRLQLLDQRKVAAQIVALKPRHVAPCVARPQRRDVGDLAGQETTAERAVGDKALRDPPLRDRKFADSAVEGGVWCELVSEFLESIKRGPNH